MPNLRFATIVSPSIENHGRTQRKGASLCIAAAFLRKAIPLSLMLCPTDPVFRSRRLHRPFSAVFVPSASGGFLVYDALFAHRTDFGSVHTKYFFTNGIWFNISDTRRDGRKTRTVITGTDRYALNETVSSPNAFTTSIRIG